MKYFSICLLFLSLSLETYGQSRESRLNRDFREYRDRTISLIERDADPHCLLKKIIPGLKRAMILFCYSDDQPRSQVIRAWCFRDTKTGALVVVINSRLNWNPEDAAVTLAHELLHLTLDDQGRPFCGPDVKEPDGIPACVLFGKPAFTSADISEAIREHLALSH